MRDRLALDRRMARDAGRFDLYQALRLIECAHPEHPRLGRALRPRDEPVRLAQQVELGFNGKDVAAYEPARETRPARLSVHFGLLGTDGPMPLHLAEYVRDRLRHAGDATWSRFLDLFHHRMLSLLYRAWAASQPVIDLDRCEGDGFVRYVGSLCGFGTAAARERDAIEPYAKLYFSGLLAGRARPAGGLAAVLSEYFGVPVAIDEFVGQWLTLPDDAQMRLAARAAAPLGEGRVLGRSVWDRQHKFRVVLGPLTAAERRCFSPGTRGFTRLADWVRLYTGGLLDWDVEVRLAPGAAAPMRLGQNARLARESWLGCPASRAGAPWFRFRGDTRIAAAY